MKGGARNIFLDFQQEAAKSGNAFSVCRVILLARIVPERLTPELDDPALEARLREVIRIVTQASNAGDV